MTSKEYNTIVAEIKERLAKLEAAQPAEEPPKPPHPRWKAKFGKEYFIIRDRVIAYYSGDDGFDDAMHNIGNYFSSEEEAEFMLERLKVLAEMREWAGSWHNVYTLAWDNIHHKIITRVSLVYQGEMCFATREDAENCVKAVGEDRIKKYYFMIPEEETNND